MTEPREYALIGQLDFRPLRPDARTAIARVNFRNGMHVEVTRPSPDEERWLCAAYAGPSYRAPCVNREECTTLFAANIWLREVAELPRPDNAYGTS